MWLSVWSKVQIVCVWFSWCHCNPKTPLSLASLKSKLVLFFWYRLTQVVLEKRPLNGCSSSYIYLVCFSTPCVACQVHKLTHTGVKRFACPVCGRLHITSSRLSAHLRTHSDEKRYGWDHTHHSIADQTIAVLPGTKAHRSNWCSASYLGWPFPAVKY